MTQRNWILLLALAATVAAVAFVPDGAHTVVATTPPTKASMPVAVRPASQPYQTPLVASLRDRSADEPAEVALFASRSWAPPAPPTPIVSTQRAEPPPAPAPTAPPVPFKYLGRYEEVGDLAVFLELQQQPLVARVGDTLADGWKVESIETNRMVLVYEPLNQKRTLDWTDAP